MKTQLLTASLFCTSLFLFQSCSSDKTQELSSLKWMLGNWESKNEEGTLYEAWTESDDSTYLGHAYAISVDGDTTFSENAKVMLRKGQIVYSVTVNNEETTDFTLVDIEEQAVFENINHDYPQRIIYKKMSSDSLFARIEGTVDGADNFEEFRYGKAN
jgi:hypothetical protein